MAMPDTPDFPHYLTPAEAAAYLRVSKSYLDKLRSNGGGPAFIKLGSRVRYRIDILDQWMLAREVSSTSEISAALAA